MDGDIQTTYDQDVQAAVATGAWHRALNILVRGYQDAIVGFCSAMLGNEALAEEVAQEVFLAAYKTLSRFRHQASVRTWLFAIARKQCLKALRDHGRHRRLEREQQATIAETAHRQASVAPEDDPERRLELVKEGLKALDKAERAMLLLRYESGLQLAEIATILGISETSVRRRLARALQGLREVINHEA